MCDDSTLPPAKPASPHPLTDGAVASLGATIYLLGGISHDPLATILTVHPP